MSSGKRKQKGYYYYRGKEKKQDKLNFSMYAMSIIYFAGAIALRISSYQEIAVKFIPFVILLSLALLFLNHHNWDIRFIYFLIIVGLAGFFLSLWGQNTGKVFGPIKFDATLGYKISDVPVVMPALWLMLILSAGFMMKNMKTSAVLRALVGATAIMLLDMIMEPFADKYDFWSFHFEHGGNSAPNQNYFAWFLFSFVALLYFNIIRVKLRNKFGTFLFILNVAFFLFCILFRIS